MVRGVMTVFNNVTVVKDYVKSNFILTLIFVKVEP